MDIFHKLEGESVVALLFKLDVCRMRRVFISLNDNCLNLRARYKKIGGFHFFAT